MANHKKIENQSTTEEVAESFIYPDTKSKSERKTAISAFQKFRKETLSAQTNEDKRVSLLLQLKIILEDYVISDSSSNQYDFGYFLKEYIIRLGLKSNQFANDIGVNPSELSQIISKHRKPTDKIIYRLDIHSNKNFPAILWFKILEKDRTYELTHNREIINSESEYVKHRLEFSI